MKNIFRSFLTSISVLRIELGLYSNAGNEKTHLPFTMVHIDASVLSGEPSSVPDTIPGEPGNLISLKTTLKQ